MRILLTNAALMYPGGTEGIVFDVAQALQRMGHVPWVFSPRLGAMAARIAGQGIPVVSDLRHLPQAPDLIHGHHHLETMMALAFFPGVPALYHCHGFLPWQETPPRHPRIYRYLAIGDKTAAFVRTTTGVAPDNIRIVFNYADMQRFRPTRAGAPVSLSRALIYDRYIAPAQSRLIVDGCRAEGVACDTFDRLSPPVTEPEKILPAYDVVFAVGKSAIEAMACGAAVIICTETGIGSLINRDNVAKWQRRNFSCRSQRIPITSERVRACLQRYDAAQTDAVRAFIREQASLDRFVRDLVEEHHAVCRRHAACRDGGCSRDDRLAERDAFFRYGLDIKTLLLDLESRLGVERDRANRNAAETARNGQSLSDTQSRIQAMEATLAWRSRRMLLGLPLIGFGVDAVGRMLGRRRARRSR